MEVVHPPETASVSTRGHFYPCPHHKALPFEFHQSGFCFSSFLWHCTILHPSSHIKYFLYFQNYSNSGEAIFIKHSQYASKVSLSFPTPIGSIYFLLPSHPLRPDTSSSWRRTKRAAAAAEVTRKEQPSGCLSGSHLNSQQTLLLSINNRDHRAASPHHIMLLVLLHLRKAFFITVNNVEMLYFLQLL